MKMTIKHYQKNITLFCLTFPSKFNKMTEIGWRETQIIRVFYDNNK